MVRAIVPPDVERKLKEMAAKESRTLSAMIALLLARAVEQK
jgi:CopG-like RHH_1 or ribbon-helix-helix domain, RHH_5